MKNIFNYKNKVDIRYFTSSKFHPKLYIFGNKIAFVGSSNLTDAGLGTRDKASNYEFNVLLHYYDDVKFWS